MKQSLVILVLSQATLCSYGVDVPLYPGTVMRFASLEEGQQILGNPDDFVLNMSPFDRQARTMSQNPVSEEELLAFVSKQARNWREYEISQTTPIIESIAAKLQRLQLSLPPVIYLIKTTGLEEGNANYTRQNAIILPSSDIPEAVLIHEIFHVFSRHNPDLRDEIYAIIGFKPCGMPIPYPDNLAPLKITNPDAPVTEHYITVHYADQVLDVAPILFSNTETYGGGSFFNYLTTGFMAVEQIDGNWTYRLFENEPLILESWELTDLYEQIGMNTFYIIHPDEIMADNFSFLVNSSIWHLKTPRIIEEMGLLFNVEFDDHAVAGQPIRQIDEDEAFSTALAPDGRQILFVDTNNNGRIFDLETGLKIKSYIFDHNVYTIALSSNGLILTGGRDNTARIWDMESGEEIARLDHTSTVTTVAFSPDGSLALTGSSDKMVKLWDVTTGLEIYRIKHSKTVMSVVFSPDGSQILTGSYDGKVSLWDTATGNRIRTFLPGYPVYCLTFSPDGTQILVGGGENSSERILSYGMATLWDITTGEKIQSFTSHTLAVRSVTVSPDGSQILTGSSDATASLWDIESGNELRIFRQTASVNYVAFTPQGRQVITCGYTGAEIWDIEDLAPETSSIHSREWLQY